MEHKMHTAQSNIHTPPFFNHVKILPDPVLYVKIHFKFILSSVFMYYEWPPSPRSPFQNPVCNSTISHRYTRPSHYFLLANFITRIKLDHVYKSRNSSFSSSSGPLLVIPIRHAYLPWTPPLELLQSVFLPGYRVTVYGKTHSKFWIAFNFKSPLFIPHYYSKCF